MYFTNYFDFFFHIVLEILRDALIPGPATPNTPPPWRSTRPNYRSLHTQIATAMSHKTKLTMQAIHQQNIDYPTPQTQHGHPDLANGAHQRTPTRPQWHAPKSHAQRIRTTDHQSRKGKALVGNNLRPPRKTPQAHPRPATAAAMQPTPGMSSRQQNQSIADFKKAENLPLIYHCR